MLCLSSLLFFGSFNMIVPELPSYLTHLGGAEYKGLIISLFTVTAMLSRPFSGKLADRIGRKPVIIAGSAVCLLCSLVYPILSSVGAFFLLRLLHGFSTGFTPTGQSAYLSDVIPAKRRGEAMGLLGTAGTLGSASGPAIGGVIANNFGLDWMFYCSSLFALIAITIVVNLKETATEKTRFRLGLLKIKRHDLFEPRVLMPCLIMALCAYAYGAAFTLLPDFGEHVGIRNKGLLFTCLTIASLTVRLIGGKASDHYGRANVLKVSSFIIAAGMLVIAFAATPLQLISGVFLYGLGQGITSPTLLAWSTDLSDTNHKGRGIASLYIFMEFGIGIGAFASGLIYSNQTGNLPVVFIICSSLSLVAFLYVLIKPATSKHKELVKP
nr:MFS transporter [Chryseosolibacter indicus]